MKAFVLAAGLGTRLRPLTFKKPKPLIEVNSRPVIDYVLEWLANQGIKEVIINLHYMPNMIKRYLSASEFVKIPMRIRGSGGKNLLAPRRVTGRQGMTLPTARGVKLLWKYPRRGYLRGGEFGLKITYSYEKNILGTAGALKKKEKELGKTFLVTACDSLTNIDIKKALAFHKNKKALATMILKEIKNSEKYRIIGLDRQGMVCQFLNKYKSQEPETKAVHTGIVILEPEVLKYIPFNKFYGLEKVYLQMLERGDPLFGYLTGEFWCEVGSLKSLEEASKIAFKGLF
ncbi:MAG: NTP transferase domain-containing protein [Firmicutes bacterium]|nr:NTP transferase domain-containing protein [Bacillota bacterium]